jgi:hypothetical protein
MADKSNKDDHCYGIGAVARLTGLTDHTIRVWERRYSAVVAERAPNGRRVYGPADVHKLRLLKQLTDQGFSIGQIAGDTVEALRQRARSLDDFAGGSMPDRIAVAILGDFLPSQFSAHGRDVAPVEIAVADTNRDRFLADLGSHEIDVIVLETPVLDNNVSDQLLEYMEHAGAAGGVIVYNFGRGRDADVARDARTVVVRAPVNVDEARAAILRAFAPGAPLRPRPERSPNASAEQTDVSAPIAPRRFDSKQLATLAHASTAIDCECPHHLAQLVSDLTAFEIYSASCANRDEEDAELHQYLHRTTAQARALIEAALQRVADAEGIAY